MASGRFTGREKEGEWEVKRGGPAGFGTTCNLQALGG